jgi:hypothetical protein
MAVILLILHLALAAFLLFVSFLADGQVPGLTADESAALGFLFFFGLGLPVLLIGFGTVLMSIYVGQKLFAMLAVMLLASTILASINVWTGSLASLAYFSLGVWALIQSMRSQPSH